MVHERLYEETGRWSVLVFKVLGVSGPVDMPVSLRAKLHQRAAVSPPDNFKSAAVDAVQWQSLTFALGIKGETEQDRWRYKSGYGLSLRSLFLVYLYLPDNVANSQELSTIGRSSMQWSLTWFIPSTPWVFVLNKNQEYWFSSRAFA